MEPIWAVGLMTGTVLDGNIDVALIKTDGERIDDFGTYTLAPYPQSIRTLLEETLTAGTGPGISTDRSRRSFARPKKR